jgi:protein-L-isoaspartate(D-aspartate) O-methyltransferase
MAAPHHAYARQMMEIVQVNDARVEAVLARIGREDFLGKPPWLVMPLPGYPLTTADPADLYQDALVALDAARGINNGSPSLHALMLHHLDVQPGARVLHVGAGGGYYTAMLAELAGPEGHVTAVEFDPALARAARANLAPWANVTVIEGDGARFPTAAIDRIYVNFAVADPADIWLDRLTVGGRLVFPLGTPRPHPTGAVLLITHTRTGFAARHLSPCSFIGAEGPLAGSAEHREALRAAFLRGGVEFVQSLLRNAPPPSRCWFWCPRWSLSYDAPAGGEDAGRGR